MCLNIKIHAELNKNKCFQMILEIKVFLQIQIVKSRVLQKTNERRN